MAEQERRKAGAEPISRHPLFPAIVALWVGALFGLGSILVSPMTVERIVTALGIDRVVPMAAPPLGTTMRILLALAMTGLGAAIGALVARRLARPKPVAQADSLADDQAEPVEADAAAPEAEAVEPFKPGRIAGRRRALALDPEADLPTPEERAPMPGRDPQILNVAEFDIDTFDDDVTEAAPTAFRPAAVLRDLDDAEEPATLPAWLDAESAWHEPAAERPTNTFVPTTPAGAQIFQQVFEARLDQDAEHGQDNGDDARPHTAPPIANRLFETYSREMSVRTEEAARSEPGFKLLPRLHAGTWPEAEASEATTEPTAAEPEIVEDVEAQAEPFAAPVAPVIDAFEETPAPEADTPQFATSSEFEATVEDVAPEPRAASRIAEAALDDLSPVELLERLALAMAERRDQARRAAEAAEAAAAAAPIAVEFAALREVPAPEADSTPPAFERLAPGPFATVAPFASPVIESEVEAQDTIETPIAPETEAPASITPFVPAALRPVGFGGYDDDHADDEALPAYIPPRHIGLTAVDTAIEQDDTETGLADTAFPASPFTAEDAGEEEDDTVLQQGYSSLLNLSRHAAPQHRFAALKQHEDFEQDPDLDDMPQALLGEDTRDAVPFARPTLAPAPDSLSDTIQAAPLLEDRLFDAPGRPDQEATERALRAALATLQRMSGAA